MQQKSKRYRQLQKSYYCYHFGSILIVLLCIVLAGVFYFTDIRYTMGLLHLALIAFLLLLAIYFRMAANETRQVLGQQEFIAILLNTWLKKGKGKK